MAQDSVSPPEMAHGPGYGYLYSTYLYITSWALRRAVASTTGSGELFSETLTVETPGLGEGHVNICVCLPEKEQVKKEQLPLIVVIEGGGFILGQPSDGEQHDRELCEKLRAVVISVDYAKAPRYPFPHALLQIYEVLRWALNPASKNLLGRAVDPSRVAVMGNSAGGNLTAALNLLLGFTAGLCCRFREQLPKSFRIVAQVLLYPSTACHQPYAERLETCGDNDDVMALSLPSWAATLMEAAYLPPPVNKQQMFVSPVLASAQVLKLLQIADALVITAGKNCLKTEGRQYARNLRSAGVGVWEHTYEECIHGFCHYKEGQAGYRRDDVEDCHKRTIKFLQERFS